MSGEDDKMRFDVKRGREHQSSCQERKITSDSMSEEQDKMILHVSRGK
jgi:hypothetical protein